MGELLLRCQGTTSLVPQVLQNEEGFSPWDVLPSFDFRDLDSSLELN
jgi:hypothetical protein